MSYIKPDTPYPVYAQPSLLTAMSIACQNQIDVCNPGNLRGPVNIYTMVLADS